MTTVACNTPPPTHIAEIAVKMSNSITYFRRCSFPFKDDEDDVVVINNVQPSYDCDLDDDTLTEQSMNFALSSFAEEWDKEDDELWNCY